jgi:autoinducer-2 kinase
VSRDECVLAVDAGTGSCRAAVFAADGTLRALAAEEWTHPAEPGVPGGRRFDVERNWELVTACVRRVLEDVPPAAVRAVSTTSFRGGLVLFDAAGRELWACPNGDARAGTEARELIDEGTAAELQARGGDWVSLTAPARLRWLRRHEPELWRRTAAVGLVNDWLTRRLTGELVSDPSVGSSSGMFDLARRGWSSESLATCELDAAMVPALADAGTVAGELRADAAAATGLATRTPVVMGGADTALGLVGLGVAEPGRCVALGGTHWQQSLTVDEPRLDPEGRLRTLCHVLGGQWLVEGIGFQSGLALRWFRDAFCQAEIAEARRSGVDAYALMERAAATIPPGAGGVVAILSNAMDSRAWVHAPPAFAGFDLERPAETGKPAFIRAILESAAFVVRAHVEQLEAIAGRRFGTLLLAGGVARGDLWPQVIADVLGREVSVGDRPEATVRGAALAAGVGAGWHADLPAAARAQATGVARTLTPGAAAAEAYGALYPRWRRVYASVIPAGAGELLPPLWRAPGV